MFRFLYLPLLCLASTVQAEISINNQQLSINNGLYDISQDLGQTVGNNLFHTFETFNLNSGEIAQFSGSDSIQNIISRVIGGESSLINGTIRSTIPNADFYFLNPYGIVFGEHAQLDLQGSFHASTADYLKLSDGGEFHARFPENDILTTAPIASFGFLSELPASISTQSNKLIVPNDKSLSLIGGDIHLTSDTPLTADHSEFIPSVESQSILAAEHGQVNLVSLASAGEVQLAEDDVTVQGLGGDIKLDNTLIEMSCDSGGAVFVRAARFSMDNSVISSNTFGNVDGKGISFKLTEAAYMNGLNTEISVITASRNNSGGIVMEVPYLEMTGALINTASILTGRTGDIEIYARNLVMKDAAFIGSGSAYAGHSGDIKLNIEETLSITGYTPGYHISHGIPFENALSQIFSISIGAGNSGNIFINTKQLNMDATFITTDSYGTGQGGNVIVNATQVSLIDGAYITSTATNQGQAGAVKLNISEQLFIAGKLSFPYKTLGFSWLGLNSAVRSASFGLGHGGKLDIQANKITLTDGGQINADSLATGNAGDISIQTNNLEVLDNGQINTSAEYAVGGNINLTVPNLLYLQEGSITTNVQSGLGDGGNIMISQPQFAVLNKGTITAQADAGHGGNIQIVANQLLKSPTSLISASSRLGIDGNIKITSPDETVSSGLLSLTKRFAEQVQIKDACKAAIVGQLPTEFQPPLTFKVNMYRFPNYFIEDWIPSSASVLGLFVCKQ